MTQGIPPFNDIDAVLFTHNHSDHFDVNSTVEFLKNNKSPVIISTDDVIGEIERRIPDYDACRLIKLNPDLHSSTDITVNGISIQAISMVHDGKEYVDVKNLAYIIDIEGRKVLHTGDAKVIEENYLNLNLPEKNIDLLIAPFPYVGISKGRQVVEQYIKPQKMVANHLPHSKLDRFGWIEGAKKSYMMLKDEFVETIFFEELGYSISI
jgi:L-ascorbate metabolism protein UlaG (beta-lactamase superfamily)